MRLNLSTGQVTMPRLFRIATALVLTASAAHAQADRPPSSASLYLDRLTWLEAERALTPDAVVVVAMGAASKAHGPHLPLSSDFLQAEYVKERVAERTQVIVAPSIGYGYYPPFTEYPGSTTLRLSVARDVVADVCRSLARSSNARRFYIISHGPVSVPVMEQVRSQLESEGYLVRFTRWDEAKRPVAAALQQQKEGTHADEIETSMLLHVAPSLVRMERAVRDYGVPAAAGGRLIGDRPRGRGVFSPSGVYGDATLASAEKGERVVEAVVEAALRDIAELRASLLPASAPPSSYFAGVTGRYAGAVDDTISVTREGDLLAVQQRGQTKVLLQPAGKLRFGLWTTEARFFVDRGGRVTFLMLSSGAEDLLAKRIE